MNISIQEIASYCQSDCPLPPELTVQLNEITAALHSKWSTELELTCQGCWECVKESKRFWENVSLLLNSQFTFQTRFQALLLIEQRVRNNWLFEDEAIKSRIKAYLCDQTQLHCNGEMNDQLRTVCKKINDVIVEILKYQWSEEWKDFLVTICEAMHDHQKYAQNYFDLLCSIFQGFFSQQDTITLEEAEYLRDQVVKSYPTIQNCFSKYLRSETPSNILKNCFKALSSLVEWIPSYYVYMGTIIDELIELSKESSYIEEAADCLLRILVLPNNELTENFLTKIYQIKRKTLLVLLKETKVTQSKGIVPRLLRNSLHFLEQQKKDIEKHSLKMIMLEKSHRNENNYILLGLFKVMKWVHQQNASEKCDFNIENQEMIALYRFIVEMDDWDSTSIEDIMKQLLEITPSPIKKQNDQESIEKFLEIMKIVAKRENQYIGYIREEIINGCPCPQVIKLFNRIFNNFYYFISVCPTQIIKQRAFQMVALSLEQQDKLQNLEQNRWTLDLIASLKHGICLILSHERSINIPNLLEGYEFYINKGFYQDHKFIKSLLEIISLTYLILPSFIKDKLHSRYKENIAKMKERIVSDLLYLEMVAKWVVLDKEKNWAKGASFMWDIITWYSQGIQRLKNKSLASIRRAQLTEAQQELLSRTLNYLKVVQVAMPILKSDLVKHLQQEIPTIKYVKQMIDISDGSENSTQLISLGFQLMTWSFTMLTPRLMQKGINVIENHNSIALNQIASDLRSDKVCPQNIGAMLKYLESSIIAIGEWPLSEAKKVSKVTNIIEVVFKRGYGNNIPNYCSFLHAIFNTSVLPGLSSQLISQALTKVFQIGIDQRNRYIEECLHILETIFTEFISSPSKQKVLSVYIIDCLSQTYFLIINRIWRNGYLAEFCDVLFMGLAFVKSMKEKLVPYGTESNIQMILGVIIGQTKVYYPNFSQSFLEKVCNLLRYMLNVSSKAIFAEKMKDLAIILKRGY